jgi:hypothetical protein
MRRHRLHAASGLFRVQRHETPNGMPLTGRRRATRDGYRAAPPLGAPVEWLVRRHCVRVPNSATTSMRPTIRRLNSASSSAGTQSSLCTDEPTT